MTESSMPISDRAVAQAKPQLTAAQKALLERKVLPLNSLLHGAYYNGLLDDMTTIGRWHEQKRSISPNWAWTTPPLRKWTVSSSSRTASSW